MSPSIIEQSQSKFVLINQDSLYNLLSTAENLEDAIKILDQSLVPVTKFNDGLATREDKTIIDYLATNASDKIYVYSNQEEAFVSPTTRIVIADNEGLTIQYPNSNTARIGLSPHFNELITPDGIVAPTVDNKSIEFINSDTVDVLIADGKIQIDATKTKEYALAMSLVLGG